jgi:hypothetical protein
MATQLNSEDVVGSIAPVRWPSEAGGNEVPPLVSVVMPCLNEARTVAGCIREAFAGLAAANLDGEVIVADNGSSDESVKIAIAEGARVVHVSERGYGSALRGGFAAARGKYIVMGDADGSYDFGEIPRFVAKLEEGYDLVMGNRFAGGIEKGAMPWHHRYIGNPVLSGIGRVLHGGNCRDWHCGLRGLRRDRLLKMNLQSTGMELTSEILISVSTNKYMKRSIEIPIALRRDGRGTRPHLRSFTDGLRHLRLLLTSLAARSTIAAICALCAMACPGCGQQGGEALKIQLSPSFQDLGVVEQGSVHTVDLELLNNDESQVKILEVHTTCGCLAPQDFIPVMLPPGKSCKIPITYSAGYTAGFSEKRIIVELIDPESDEKRFYRSFLLRALVKEEIVVRPSQIRAVVGESDQEQFEVSLSSENGNNYKIQDVLTTSSLISVRPSDYEITPGHETKLLVTLDTSNPLLGHIVGKIVLKLDGGRVTQVSIPVSCLRNNRIATFPTSLTFRGNQSKSQRVELTTSIPSHVIACVATGLLLTKQESSADGHEHFITVYVKSSLQPESSAIEITLQDNLNRHKPVTILVPIHFET